LPPPGALRTLKSSRSPAALTEGGPGTSGIFISYRREDAPAHAGRLYDGLSDEFGSERVFMDVDTLEPGVDFVERIHSAVSVADVLLVVIGRGWLNAKDLDGERRLDDPDDFVRLEVGVALRGDPVVIPVLVGGAAMPAEGQLPPDLALLARRNALTLVDADWRSGMGRLVAALRRILEPVAEPEPEPEPGPEPEPEPRPPLPPPPPQPPPDAPGVSMLATVLGLAGLVALVAGTWLQLDSWAHPSPNRGDRDGLGFFSGAAPVAIVVGAAGSLLLSYARGPARIGTGLLLGFALAGVARYVSAIGIFANTPPDEPSRTVAGAWLALAACVVLVAAAGVRIATLPKEREPRAGLLALLLVLGGAALVVLGTIVPFNDGPAVEMTSLIDRNGGWRAVEPIGAAILAVVLVFLTGRLAGASSAVIGLGTYLTLLWGARYIGFPAWQPDDVSSIAAGGFIGLAGGLAVLVGGVLARPQARRGTIPRGRPAQEVR
jgi:TIR domain